MPIYIYIYIIHIHRAYDCSTDICKSAYVYRAFGLHAADVNTGKSSTENFANAER